MSKSQYGANHDFNLGRVKTKERILMSEEDRKISKTFSITLAAINKLATFCGKEGNLNMSQALDLLIKRGYAYSLQLEIEKLEKQERNIITPPEIKKLESFHL